MASGVQAIGKAPPRAMAQSMSSRRSCVVRTAPPIVSCAPSVATTFPGDGVTLDIAIVTLTGTATDDKGAALPYKLLVVELKFARDRRRVITNLKRVSKPGRRVYARKDRLPRVLGGLGTAIMSTSEGLITNRQAAERGVGGEVIAFVW